MHIVSDTIDSFCGILMSGLLEVRWLSEIFDVWVSLWDLCYEIITNREEAVQT